MSWDSVWQKLEALLASPGFRPSPPAYAGISLAAFDDSDMKIVGQVPLRPTGGEPQGDVGAYVRAKEIGRAHV